MPSSRALLWSTVAAFSLLAHTEGANAQQAAQADATAAGPAEAVEAEQARDTATDSEIVVTGSRILRDGATAPTPVTVITAETLAQTSPSNIPDALNKLPQFLGSSSQYHSVTFNATAALQGNYLNLRALGSQRVLVLLDGNRVPPTAASNAVDSNIIPQMLVERVDVVTGGASAAYGSDAVSGVVNYVLNKRFTGVEAKAQAGISTYGDAPSYRFGVAAGTSFANGAGHIEGSVEYYRNDGIESQDDRPYYDILALITGTGTPASPFIQFTNTRFNDITFGGLIRTGPLAGNSFNPDGSVSPFVTGTPTSASNVVVGGQGAVVPPTVLVPRLETRQAFARASYDFTPDIGFFLQGSYARSETGYLSGFANRRSGTGAGITIFSDNPYLTPAVRAALGATPSFGLSRSMADAPGNQQTSVTESYNIQTGLTGKFGDSFLWDINYGHGRAQLDLSQVEQNNRNFYAAVDAVRAPDGNIVCGVTIRNPQLVPGCVPLNVLGVGNLSPAALAFIYRASRSRVVNTLHIVSANLRGELFQLPAGPVAFAIGGEARWQRLDQTSNADPTQVIDYTGIRGVPANVLPFATTNVGLASGRQNVKEAYAELNVPVLSDQPFFHRLELNGAARYTDYRTSGSVMTWKVGAIYEPVPDLRFRGTVSRDIAAPSLFDLFAGRQVAIAGFPDPHTGVTSTGQLVSSGNANLQPERAKTLVGGIVLTPTFLSGLSMSIDAYRITIKDAIGSQNANTELLECEASGGTAPVCDLITRPFPFSDRSPANFPTQIIVAPQNLSQLVVKGIDFEANYRIPLGAGRVDLRAFVSYLGSYETTASATALPVERAGRVVSVATTSGLPKWRGLLQQSYTIGGFTVLLTERFTGSYLRATKTEAFDPAILHAPNRTYTDLYLSQRIGDDGQFSLFFQVDNLFNVKPPLLAATVNPGFTYPTDKTLYDVLGRNFTAGARVRF